MAYSRVSKARILMGDASISAGMLQSSAVTAAKLGTGSVTSAKLGDASVLKEKLGITVRNETGSTIATDKIVAIVGFDVTTGLPKIVLADADVAAYEDLYVTTAAILTAASGVVVKAALSAANLNTNSASTAGDPVYLSTTAGGFTHTAPTGSTSRVHPVGFVVVKSATVGSIQWSIGPVRSNGTNELQDVSVTTGKIAAAAVTGPKLATGILKVAVVNGVDEPTAHSITVSGMAVGDEIVAVLTLTTAASIATLAKHTGTFTAASGAITTSGAEVNNTNNQYVIFWNDLT